MAELGKIEKPSAEEFAGKRKLYCVPNIIPFEDAPDEYKNLVNNYWSEVEQQLAKLEAAGKIKRIFCESIFVQGDEALEALSRLNERVLQIVRAKIGEGAVFTPIETEEIFGPFLDWAHCLNIVRTKEVFEKVMHFYKELEIKRLRHMQDAITSALAGQEAGLLIMRDEDRIRLELAEDIELFLVAPTSYDDIHRWVKERMSGAEV
jgi:hypothetical protein